MQWKLRMVRKNLEPLQFFMCTKFLDERSQCVPFESIGYDQQIQKCVGFLYLCIFIHWIQFKHKNSSKKIEQTINALKIYFCWCNYFLLAFSITFKSTGFSWVWARLGSFCFWSTAADGTHRISFSWADDKCTGKFILLMYYYSSLAFSIAFKSRGFSWMWARVGSFWFCSSAADGTHWISFS